MFHQHGRFYESQFPEVETTVVVQVLRVDEKSGAYVSLLEYDGKEGMINLGELSKKRIRSMAKILRVGSIEVCMVMSVDEEKGYVNLSKKRVEPEDVPPKQELFAKAKAVHSVMQHVAATHGLEVEDLCQKVSWPLHEKYPSAYDAFKKHTMQVINIWDELDFSQPGVDLSDKAEAIKEDIETHMKRRLVTSTLRLQAKCEVACTEYAGIDAIKNALSDGFKASKEECEVNIKLIAHPLFALSCICRDKELGCNTLNEAMDHIQKSIESENGTFVIISKPEIKIKDKDKDGDESSGDEDAGGSYKGSSEGSDEDETMGELSKEQLDALAKTKVDEDED